MKSACFIALVEHMNAKATGKTYSGNQNLPHTMPQLLTQLRTMRSAPVTAPCHMPTAHKKIAMVHIYKGTAAPWLHTRRAMHAPVPHQSLK